LHLLTEFINKKQIPEIAHLQGAIEELEDTCEKFQESGFEDYYAEQIRDWINNNLPWLWRTFAQMVFFGLTDDGYFCAYVPDAWSDIEFDTGMKYGMFDYGRLILRFNSDGSGVIDNTGRYDETSAPEMNRRIERMEHTLYTPLKNGGE
jgi:hypothetical protein